jgi:hypothetical protein
MMSKRVQQLDVAVETKTRVRTCCTSATTVAQLHAAEDNEQSTASVNLGKGATAGSNSSRLPASMA